MPDTNHPKLSSSPRGRESRDSRPKGADFHTGSRRVDHQKDTGIEHEFYYFNDEDDADDGNLDDLFEEHDDGKHLTPVPPTKKSKDNVKKDESVTAKRGNLDSEAQKSTKQVDQSHGKQVAFSVAYDDDDVFAPTGGPTTMQGDRSSKGQVNLWGWDGEGR